MQIMAEALGLMLPGTALMPATAPELLKAAYNAGAQLMKLVSLLKPIIELIKSIIDVFKNPDDKDDDDDEKD